jgi:hypothetical protein
VKDARAKMLAGTGDGEEKTEVVLMGPRWKERM